MGTGVAVGGGTGVGHGVSVGIGAGVAARAGVGVGEGGAVEDWVGGGAVIAVAMVSDAVPGTGDGPNVGAESPSLRSSCRPGGSAGMDRVTGRSGASAPVPKPCSATAGPGGAAPLDAVAGEWMVACRGPAGYIVGVVASR